MFTIRTPDDLFFFVVILLCATGSSALAGHFCIRSESLRSVGVLRLHTLFIGLIAVAVLTASEQKRLLPNLNLLLLANFILSLTVAVLTVRLDRLIVRTAYPKLDGLRSRRMRASSSAPIIAVRRVISTNQPQPTRAELRKPGIASKKERWPLIDLLFTAVFEELIFRGFLPSAVISSFQAGTLVTILLSTISIGYGIAHVQFGLAQVLSKTVLGLIWLVATWSSGTLLIAIMSHLYLNFRAWRDREAVSESAAARVDRRITL